MCEPSDLPGSYGSWKTWKVISVSRPGKSSNLILRHGKSWKIIVCVAHRLLQVSEQGQNKMHASYVRKYLKNKDDFDNF